MAETNKHPRHEKSPPSSAASARKSNRVSKSPRPQTKPPRTPTHPHPSRSATSKASTAPCSTPSPRSSRGRRSSSARAPRAPASASSSITTRTRRAGPDAASRGARRPLAPLRPLLRPLRRRPFLFLARRFPCRVLRLRRAAVLRRRVFRNKRVWGVLSGARSILRGRLCSAGRRSRPCTSALASLQVSFPAVVSAAEHFADSSLQILMAPVPISSLARRLRCPRCCLSATMRTRASTLSISTSRPRASP